MPGPVLSAHLCPGWHQLASRWVCPPLNPLPAPLCLPAPLGTCYPEAAERIKAPSPKGWNASLPFRTSWFLCFSPPRKCLVAKTVVVVHSLSLAFKKHTHTHTHTHKLLPTLKVFCVSESGISRDYQMKHKPSPLPYSVRRKEVEMT